MRILECFLENLPSIMSLKYSSSLTLRLSRNHSQKTLIIFLTVVKFPIFSLLMRRFKFVTKSKLELLVLTTEINNITISFNSVEKTSISFLHSLLSEINSETDADNSHQSLTAAQLIGIMLGQVLLFTLSLTDNIKLTRLNLESRSTQILSALLQQKSTILSVRHQKTSIPSSEERTTPLLLHILTLLRLTRKCLDTREELFPSRSQDIKEVLRD